VLAEVRTGKRSLTPVNIALKKGERTSKKCCMLHGILELGMADLSKD
jgi:hypothetical protein